MAKISLSSSSPWYSAKRIWFIGKLHEFVNVLSPLRSPWGIPPNLSNLKQLHALHLNYISSDKFWKYMYNVILGINSTSHHMCEALSSEIQHLCNIDHLWLYLNKRKYLLYGRKNSNNNVRNQEILISIVVTIKSQRLDNFQLKVPWQMPETDLKVIKSWTM